MGEWMKNNPILSALINFALCLIVLFAIFFTSVKTYIDRRIDYRIIEEYQKPIVEKLDTLIILYSNERSDRTNNN